MLFHPQEKTTFPSPFGRGGKSTRLTRVRYNLYRTDVLDNVSYPRGTLFVSFPLQNSKSLILIHAARVGNNRHRVFVLLCARCLKPCLRGVRLQPLAKPSSRRKEVQGENALCLHAEVSVSDKYRERLERRVRYDRNMFFVVPLRDRIFISN